MVYQRWGKETVFLEPEVGLISPQLDGPIETPSAHTPLESSHPLETKAPSTPLLLF